MQYLVKLGWFWSLVVLGPTITTRLPGCFLSRFLQCLSDVRLLLVHLLSGFAFQRCLSSLLLSSPSLFGPSYKSLWKHKPFFLHFNKVTGTARCTRANFSSEYWNEWIFLKTDAAHVYTGWTLGVSFSTLWPAASSPQPTSLTLFTRCIWRVLTVPYQTQKLLTPSCHRLPWSQLRVLNVDIKNA